MRLLTISLLALSAVFAGCASKGDWSREIPPGTKLDSPPIPATQRFEAKPTVVVRWPAIVSHNARGRLVQNYRKYVNDFSGYDTPMGDLAAFPEFLETLSTFYAGELYWGLRRSHPDLTVLLEPQQVVVSSGGTLGMRPMVDAAVPVDLSTNVIAYTSPNSALPLVVDILSVALQTSPRRSPANCGQLVDTINAHPVHGPGACVSKSNGRKPITHWVLDGSTRTDGVKPSEQRKELPLSAAATLMIPMFVEGEAGIASTTMSAYAKRSFTPETAAAESVVVNPFLQNFAYLALSGIAVIQPLGSAPPEYVDYIERFDSALATSLAQSRSLTQGQLRNIELLKRILEQEIKVRAARDELTAREIVAGNFGRSVRDAREKAHAEYGGKMGKMWLTTATSMLSGSAAIRSAGSGAAVLAANNSTFDGFNQQMESVGLEYVARLAPSLASAGKANIAVLEGTVSVELNDQAGLRAALKALYERRKVRDNP